MVAVRSDSLFNILLAVEGAAQSAAAVDLLTHITWPAGTSVHILGIVPERLPDMEPALEERGVVEEKRELARWRDWAAATADINKATAKLQANHLAVKGDVCEGQLGDIILRQAVDLSTDLIVVDAKRYKVLNEFHVDDSGANRLAHDAAYPSLLVIRRSEQIRPLRTILVVDDSLAARRAIEFACALSLAQWAKVTLINVIQSQEAVLAGPGFPDFQRFSLYASSSGSYASELLTVEVIDRLHNSAARVSGCFHCKHSADEILRVAQEQAAKLIVMGADSHLPEQPFHLDKVADETVRYASCSVLVVR